MGPSHEAADYAAAYPAYPVRTPMEYNKSNTIIVSYSLTSPNYYIKYLFVSSRRKHDKITRAQERVWEFRRPGLQRNFQRGSTCYGKVKGASKRKFRTIRTCGTQLVRYTIIWYTAAV